MRLEAESEVIREAFPEAYVDVAVFVTELGASTTLMFVLAMTYWLTRRRETALVVSYTLAGAAFLIGLKAILGMARPPEELFLIPLDGDEYGFPSGHTFAAVVVYGGLVAAFDRTRDLRVVAGAATLIALVALSRVVLGVHYLGDVLVGAILGIAFLFVLARLVAGDLRRGFAIAAVLAIPSIVVTGGADQALIALGGGLGGLAVSSRLEDLPALRSRLEGAILALGGLAFVAVAVVVESIVGWFEPAFVAVYAAIVVGILLAPAAVGRLRWARLESSKS